MNPKKTIFSISERKLLLRLFDMLFAIEGMALASFIFNFHYFIPSSPNIYKWTLTLIFYILFFGQIFEMYNLKVANDKYLVLRSTILTGVLSTVFYVFTPIIAPELPENRIQILYLFLSITFSIYIWRLIYINFIFSPLFFNRILIIGADKNRIESLISLVQEKANDNFIIGYICPKSISNKEFRKFEEENLDLTQLVKEHQVSEMIVDNFHKEDFQNDITSQLISLFKKGYHITGLDNYTESISFSVPESQLNERFYNHINFSKSHQNRIYLLFHRLFDVISSLIGICFLFIIIPFILIGNLFFNKGPLFYLQERVGIGGELFKIIKLRTMVKNAETNKAIWAVKDDARITKFGKFLRRSRIDEIPQFINVLKGEMSVIGPRPERPEFVKELSADYPFFTIRNTIKPGLTGWAQVEYPYASTKEEQYIKLRYDLYYIKERNLLLDFKIIIKTISTILFFRGT